MFLIKNLFDRVLFALGLLLFMQVPQFLDQYTQRLGGYLQAQKQHLSEYQGIANRQHSGDLEALLNEFYSSEKPAVKETADTINKTRQEVAELESDLDILEGKHLIYRLGHTITHVNMSVATETLRIFTPGIPLTIESFVCGLLGGILFSVVFATVMRLLRFSKKTEKKSTKPAAVRIEPSIKRVDSI